jgi:hypothetical protein
VNQSSQPESNPNEIITQCWDGTTGEMTVLRGPVRVTVHLDDGTRLSLEDYLARQQADSAKDNALNVDSDPPLIVGQGQQQGRIPQ